MSKREIDYSKTYTIPLPSRVSEFEIQSLIYSILKNKDKFIVKAEVKAYRSRLDIVVYDNKKNAQVIIEVKSRQKVRKIYRKYKQVTKYENLFNLPVVVCHDSESIAATLKQVREIMNGW